MKRLSRKFAAAALVVTAVCGGLLLTNTPKAFAAYAYNPSDLISDGIFTNSSTMNATAIQNFLNKENSGLKGYSATESCSPAKPVQPYRFTYYPHCGKKESAATIIYDAGKAYGINPQAIMATLQKEQSLITTPHPTSSQINCAMGYNRCSSFVGFFVQVDNATWQFRTDIELMSGRNWWGYTPSSYPCNSASSLYSTGLYPGRTVRFYNSSITLTLADSATAALYCYTPEAGFSGGNYNFVQAFEQWFGSTLYAWAGDVTVNTYSDAAHTQPLSLSGALPSGKTFYVTVSAINTGSQTWNSSFLHIATIDPAGRASAFKDGSWISYNRPAALMQSSVAPTQTGTFAFSMTTPNTDGEYHENFGLIAEVGRGWLHDSSTFGFDITVSNPYNGAITQLNTYRDSGYSLPVDPGELSYGEKVYVRMQVKNIGTQTWTNSFTKVAALSADANVFNDGSWASSTRPAVMQESSVAPGQTGTFTFTMTAPGTDGSHYESFQLVADGQTSGWMPGATFGFPIQVVDPPVYLLLPGIRLYRGQTIASANGYYHLDMQTDGNLVIYSPKGAIWSTGTDRKDGSTLVMQGDGNLVVYAANGKAVWSSGTAGRGNSKLVMQNDGNLVIYNSSGHATWSSGTDHNTFNTPTTLGTNQRLDRGNYLRSLNYNYGLVMQYDGNLVLYYKGHAIWSTGTNRKHGAALVMQYDGNLVIYAANGRPVWASGSAGKNSTLELQNDGNLVVRNGSGHTTWSSRTGGKT